MVKKRKKISKHKRRSKKKVKKKKFEYLIEQRAKEFAEEIEDIGKKFGIHVEKKTKKWEKEEYDWWFRTFGLIGPLFGSILSIIFLAFVIWMLGLINLPLGSGFISIISEFLFKNLHFFFAAFLFFGYSDYLSKKYSKTYWIISPIVTGIGIIIIIWIGIWILNLINSYAGIGLITSLTQFLSLNLGAIFFIFLVLGYLIVIIKKMIKDTFGF